MSNSSSTRFVLKEVLDKRDKVLFADAGRVIYENDPEWICPLDEHVENIFDPLRNPSFQDGDACRWILRNYQGDLVGRIAAFVNHRKNKNKPYPVGGIGFFECVNDEEAANLLFEQAAEWLKKRKVEAMDGPINFGENDRYWGLMVEGFTSAPFTTNYHKPYYLKLFEAYGFKVLYEMLTHEMDLSKHIDSRFETIASWLNKKSDLVFRHADVKSLPEFAGYFREIYNDAWRFHDEFTSITLNQANKFASEMKHLIIDSFCPFAFVKGEPAGFIITAPDLNQIFKSFNGRLNLVDKLLFKWRKRNNFLWYRQKGILTRSHVIAIGVKPKFQQHGIEAGMIMSSLDKIRSMGFTKMEMRWAGDFNPKVIRLNEAVGGYCIRKHVTMRCVFEKGKEIKRPPIIPLGKMV